MIIRYMSFENLYSSSFGTSIAEAFGGSEVLATGSYPGSGLEEDFKPNSDVRASGLYRMNVAKNLLEKCCAEIKQKKLIGVYV